MTKHKFPIGHSDFKKMVISYEYFIDKTLFIEEILSSAEEAILITRPRRWCKTLDIDMLKTFLEIKVDKEGIPLDENPDRVLFEGGKYLLNQELKNS